MTDQYQRFFDELAPRLETARELERELDTHLARRFNVFDYLRTDELGISRVVADLLNPEGKHGQGPLFLKLMLDACDLSDHAHLDARSAVTVDVEKTIKDDRRLDICVRIDDYCLAIENKPYAGDQPRQVVDYLAWLRRNFEKYALIYLSPSGEPPSPGSVGLADLKGLGDGGLFKVMPYYSGEEGTWDDDGFERCDWTLAEWLADCRKNCKVERLWWFLRESEEFCSRRFGGHTVASSELDAIRKFVVSDAKTWDVGLAVHRAMPIIMRSVFWRFMTQVWKIEPKETEYQYPKDISSIWNYHSQKTKSCLGMYRKVWASSHKGSSAYSTQAKYTQIRIEAESGIDRWSIGVSTENPQLIGKDQEGYRRLRDALEKIGESKAERAGWVWWQWIDDEYQDWAAKIWDFHRECEEGSGKMTMYFVEKLAKVAKVAVPIIDDYEGIS